MQVVPKLTHQRLTQLLPGTPIKLGSELVTFNSCSVRANYKGEQEVFIDYLDREGRKLSHAEFTVLQCGTEQTDAVMCKYCGQFRTAEESFTKRIQFWNRFEYHEFCVGKQCAALYQQTIRVPSQQRARTTKRRAA